MVHFSVPDGAPNAHETSASDTSHHDDEIPAAEEHEGNNIAKRQTRPSNKGKDSDKGRSMADVLVSLGLESFDFGVDLDGKPYGVRKGGHIAIPLIGSARSVRRELGGICRRALGRTPSETALTEATAALAYEAEEQGVPTKLHLRSARVSDDLIYIDMGDKAERVIQITPDGWDILGADDEIPVLFRRTNVTLALPTPERGGSLNPLWKFVNLRSDADRELIEGWLVAAWILVGLPCPILAVLGEQGAAKTSSARSLFALVDPSAAAVRRAPSDADRLLHAGAHSRSVIFDNLSSIPRWLSDGLCRYVTGESDVDRALYTNADARIIQVQGVLGFTGIDVGSLAGDLAERCVWADLHVIPATERRSERELKAAWEDVYASMVGALLDLVVQTLQWICHVDLAEKPRMADFAEVLAALDLAKNTNRLDHYMRTQQSVAQDIVDTDPFLVAITDRIKQRWEGTAPDLYRLLPRPTDYKYWPEARGTSGKLRRVAPDLRKAGWTVEETKPDPVSKRAKVWTLVPPGVSITDTELALYRLAQDMMALDVEQWRDRFLSDGATMTCVGTHVDGARSGSSVPCSEPGCTAGWNRQYTALAEKSKAVDGQYIDQLRRLGLPPTELDLLIADRAS